MNKIRRRTYDYLVCGSGPSASSFIFTLLETNPNLNILMIERGKHSKLDVLKETNPYSLYKGSKELLTTYSHGVQQGNMLGGSSSVNNYAWITPSYNDIKTGLPNVPLLKNSSNDQNEKPIFENIYNNMINNYLLNTRKDQLNVRGKPHLLQKLITWNSINLDHNLITNNEGKSY